MTSLSGSIKQSLYGTNSKQGFIKECLFLAVTMNRMATFWLYG